MNVSRCFAALADPTRREIFERISRQPVSVGALAEGLPVSRPAVSQHLKVLLEAGLVHVEAKGRQRVYEVDKRAIATMRKYLDRLPGQIARELS